MCDLLRIFMAKKRIYITKKKSVKLKFHQQMAYIFMKLNIQPPDVAAYIFRSLFLTKKLPFQMKFADDYGKTYIFRIHKKKEKKKTFAKNMIIKYEAYCHKIPWNMRKRNEPKMFSIRMNKRRACSL